MCYAGLLIALLCAVHRAYGQNPALDWPVERDKKYQISSSFGESRLDHFHNGIDLPGEGFKVTSPSDARVLYRIHAETIPGEMPFGGGNTLILDHGSMWTGYMHLKTIAENADAITPIAKGEKIGISGNSGHSGGAHLHFFIYQPGEQAMLNPLSVMGELYYQDNKPPVAKEWGVLLPEKFATVNPDKPFRMSSDYPVFLLLTDQGIGKERWGIYEYKVFLDDKETLHARFDKILFRDGIWQLANGLSFENIFYRNFYSLTNQVRRAKKVKITARDFKGNSLEKAYELKIQQN